MKLVFLLYYIFVCYIFFWSPIIGTIFCICLCCWKFRDLFQSKGLLYFFFFSLYLNDCPKWLHVVSGKHEEWREWRLLSYGMKRTESACWESSCLPLECKHLPCIWGRQVPWKYVLGGSLFASSSSCLLPGSSCITCILLGCNCNPGPLWASSSGRAFSPKGYESEFTIYLWQTILF